MTLQTPAGRLIQVLVELDEEGRAEVLESLRREMADKHPDLYRINDLGEVDYIGPRRESR
jgi:hypothetical protein